MLSRRTMSFGLLASVGLIASPSRVVAADLKVINVNLPRVRTPIGVVTL
jgi:hypothetical protein